ncbi:transposase [Sulfitobacter sp. 15WGC]|nr:transposase [Sulfitobacter sp. 15WGC]
MIQRSYPKLSISQQCKLMKLSRSAFYYTLVELDKATLSVMKADDRAFTEYPFFGTCQIAAYLRREGIVVGRHRVRRLMAMMAWGQSTNAIEPAASSHPVHPYLLRKMLID